MPVVAALNGHAIGGGLELALACDLRVAAAGARLGMPPARLGLVYSHTGAAALPGRDRRAPRTRELFLTARLIDAETALSWGLVNEVVERDALAARGVALAAHDRRAVAAVAAREQARAARAAGAAGRRDEAELNALREAGVPQRGLRRGRARVRGEAISGVEGTMNAEARLKQLGIELPDVMPPAGSYVPAKQLRAISSTSPARGRGTPAGS